MERTFERGNGTGSVLSVNVGGTQTVVAGACIYATAIGKRPVAGPVALRGINLAGDDQADRSAHGGPDRVVYAYASEDYAYWSRELGRELAPGLFGENLTIRGIDANGAVVGERWHVGDDVELEVSLPRIPCYKLANAVGETDFVKRIGRSLRLGPYLRVVREGAVTAGDPIAVGARPAHGITIADVARIQMFDRNELPRLLDAPQLGEEFLGWVRATIAKRH